MTTVGVTGYGRYVPDEVVTGEEIAAESGVPEEVVVEKMGLREKRVCPPDGGGRSGGSRSSSDRGSGGDHASDMCVAAAEAALEDAGITADDVDLVCYHGSEFKDFVVWSAAADVADRIGADDAYATESYTLCAGTPIALRQVRAQLVAERIDTALLVTASREEDLVDYGNERSSFMFNFGSGAGALVVEAEPGDRTRARVHESAAVTAGSFSRDVVMPAGGSVEPPSHESVEAGRHALDVPDQDGMKERLGPVSLPNFLEVADTALDRSGFERSDLDFVAVTHMKRSFHETLLEELGLDPDADSYYLDEYGHVQSADQVLAIHEALREGRLEAGDLLCFLAAGTGYTWAATVLTWQG